MTRHIPIVALACLVGALACTASSVGAATIRWKAPVSGLWSDAANWEGGAVPGPADDALIDLDGTYTVTVGNTGVHRVSLGAGAGTQTLLLGHAYLSVYDTLFIQGQGTLDLNGKGTVTGPVVDGGLVVAHGAANRITDVVHVRSGGTLRLGGSGEPLGATDTLSVTAELFNDGTVTSWLANGRLLMGGLTLHNRASGTIITTGAPLSIEAALDNAGTVSQRGANPLILDRAGASHLSTGTLDIDSQGYLMLDGALQVNGGSLANSGAIALGYNSQLVVRGGGTLALEAGTTIASAGGSVVVDDATLHGDTLALDVDLELRRATVDVARLGVVRDRLLTLGDLTLTAPLWIAGTLVCDGAVVRADTLVTEPTSQVVVNAGVTLVLAKGFVNRGVIRAQGGDGTVQLDGARSSTRWTPPS